MVLQCISFLYRGLYISGKDMEGSNMIFEVGLYHLLENVKFSRQNSPLWCILVTQKYCEGGNSEILKSE